MSLELFYHPLSSYCWKVLTALYENETPFEHRLLNLGDPAARDALVALWPIAKFPVLSDGERVIPEASIIIDYLAHHHAGRTALIPADPDEARSVRLKDRFYDLYVHDPMQRIVGNKLRPADAKDPHGVAECDARLETAYGMIEQEMATRTWANGASFTMADCAAAPALHYANRVHPIGDARPNTLAYLERLKQRPSFARVLREAEPYAGMFPGR